MSWTEGLNPELVEKIKTIDSQIDSKLKKCQEIALSNQAKVLNAFRRHQVAESSFIPSTGYGYDDLGRDVLEHVYAEVFGTESALVRPQMISGTHAIATALFGVLRPDDELIYLTGTPYDTLLEVIGIQGDGIGSFKEYSIGYQEVALTEEGQVNLDQLVQQVSEKTKVIAIQRSRGYAQRPSYTVAQIKEMIEFIKTTYPDIIIFVDNCYGEFAEELEPTNVGADLMAGSLIKNPGGGLAKTGGYIVGREELVTRCAYRLTTPGIGKEAGAMLYSTHEMLQGFFLAPHVVSQAVQGAIFTAALLEAHQLKSKPNWQDERTDLIQMIEMETEENMIRFCQTIQKYSPVDSHVVPYPAYMPGYEDDVIMAAGTFVQGASIELSADGPIRAPYILYVQGGLTYEHVKLAVSQAVNEVYYNSNSDKELQR